MTSILDTIGNTPLVQLRHITPKDGAAVFVKLEYFNPTSSYKDRMALAVIDAAEKRGELLAGMTVVENTAGSTGTSLAMVCKAKGYNFKAVTSDAFAREKLSGMQLFGAGLELIDSRGAGITPELVPRMMERVRELSKQNGIFWTRQFENSDVLTGYDAMATEIVAQIGRPIHHFCAGVGTAGMFVGVAKSLRNHYRDMRCVALEPDSSPLLTRGIAGNHNVDGIAPGFIPPFLKSFSPYDVASVNEADARIMAKRLVAEEGIFAGTSTGLNVAAAVAIASTLPPEQTVVTVANDSGMKYLSTGLFTD